MKKPTETKCELPEYLALYLVLASELLVMLQLICVFLPGGLHSCSLTAYFTFKKVSR